MLRKGRGDLYKAPTKEESEKLRGEGYQIKFIDFRFERWQFIGFGKARRQDFHKLHVLGVNNDMWDKVRGLGSETWKECE